MFKNIKKVVFCINKIDKINFRKKEFENIKNWKSTVIENHTK